ncbi:WD40/YVTN/BNR-like repeat-containing protein [Elongatibacter sediminis]|uniref:Sortilin N-terminal domain-containing protein n=1 Tax=Elongatibacter sediminis TaxID=3119006 RepID=A0AAW9RFV1_9GAMM
MRPKAFRATRSPLLIGSLLLAILLSPMSTAAQDTGTDGARDYFDGLQARNIGPWRGGRVTTVAGVPGNPYVYYMGATAGVWKTTNAGSDWVNVSDGFFRTAPAGAIDVSISDPNVVVAGTGESPFRGVMSAQGDGVYKSTDAGRTWKHIGLENSRQIGSVKIHPTDPDTIWVAVQGGAWAPHEGRGVWKTTDGGSNWRQVLTTDNDTTGAVDLKYDPSNPRILYVTLWDMQRQAWEIRSGGPGSSLYKSADGGETWKRIAGNGLPEAFGKAGVAPSPAKPGRVWALIEAEEEDAGLYRSEDFGESWTRVNSDPLIRSRAWYYMHIHADPRDEETVYVLNAPFMKSVDGGKTFERVGVPHGDVHALWINPDHPKWMINGNDGGANVSFDGGTTWSTQHNQPTGQFYRVNTDNQRPYRVYGAQQDNSTLAVSSRGYDGSIGREDYEVLGGCENGYMALNPDNPRYIYSGCYLGLIEEYDRETKTARSIQAYEEFGIGVQPKDARYRANWNAPILVSQHDPEVIYHATHVLLKSTDRGFNWTEVSPDLTRNEADKQGKMGRPYSNENIEVYNTIFALAESPHDASTLWAGSDDGLVHVTTDAGTNWRNVTPRGIGRAMINAIEISPHDPETVYVAVHKFKSGDDTPYIYRTDDNGKRWSRITGGIPENEYVRVVREDPQRPGLLYAGTERGLHVSFDRGESWQSLQLNLPAVPVTDLKVQDNDLVLSTQGRGFWIVDDITPLRQWSASDEEADVFLYTPAVAYRWANGNSFGKPEYTSPNVPDGALLYFALATEPDLEAETLKLEILGADGAVLRTLTSDAKAGPAGGKGGNGYALPARRGINRVAWDLKVDPVTRVPGLYQFGAPAGGAIPGYTLPPGDYTVRLSLGDTVHEQPLTLRWDPVFEYTQSTVDTQQEYLRRAFDMLDELYRSVLSLQTVKQQVEARIGILETMEEQDEAIDRAQSLIDAIEAWESTVINRKRSNGQNVLAYEPGLNFKLFTLISSLDDAMQGVTMGQRDRFDDLERDWRSAMAARDGLLDTEVADFNAGGGSTLLVPPLHPLTN